jgi:hypothetical protein
MANYMHEKREDIRMRIKSLISNQPDNEGFL